MYLSAITCVVTVLLNYIHIPMLSDFFLKYFNLFSAAVMLIIYSRCVGVTNKEDLKFGTNKVINVRTTVILILTIEFIISLFFPYFYKHNERIFSYLICLSPSIAFILTRPLLRLDEVETKLEKMHADLIK